MAAPRQFPIWLVLLLSFLTIAWWALDHYGVLGPINNVATNSLFLFRGEIPALDRTKPGNPPLNVVYVDIDAPTVDWAGERPWPRDVYADLINDVLLYGHAKAVGLDFFLSPAGMKSRLVDQTKARQGNENMSAVMQHYPQAVIAAVYSNIRRDASMGSKDPKKQEIRQLAFPYIYNNNYDPKKNPYPESPSFPIIGLNYGSVGLIDVDITYSATGGADNIPRWIPLFADTEGPDHTMNLLGGILEDFQLTKDDVLHTDGSYVVANPKTLDALTLPEIQKKTFYNMSFELALAYLGLDHSNVRRTDDALQAVDKNGKVLLDIPLREKQIVEINWFSKWHDEQHPEFNPRISAMSVLTNAEFMRSGTPEDKAKAQEGVFNMFKDAIVLIGPTDPTLQDIASTPFDGDPQPKVGVYGNLLKTFFSGEFIRRPPAWVDALLQILLTLLVGGLAVYSGHHAGLAKGAAVLLLGGYILGVYEIFAHLTIALPLVAPVGSAFTAAFVGAIIRLVDEEKQKKRIKGMFGTYLAPEVVNDMVSSGQEPQLGGHNVNITCFFSDVQGFSTFSEVLTPEQLTNLMNEYFTAMTDILQHERGSLDKFIGDAIVAMYGAPVESKEHALRACVATCRMQKSLGDLRQKWISEGDKWPEKVHKMRMRIGLNTGKAIVGNMGSASRFNYTMMGDTVNLAARCESSAKQFGVYSMCTEDTKREAEAQGSQLVFRRLNKIKVKGKTIPVEVYEITCLREDATPDTFRCIELFEKGLALYFAQKWDEAKVLFAEAYKLEPLQPGRDP